MRNSKAWKIAILGVGIAITTQSPRIAKTLPPISIQEELNPKSGVTLYIPQISQAESFNISYNLFGNFGNRQMSDGSVSCHRTTSGNCSNTIHLPIIRNGQPAKALRAIVYVKGFGLSLLDLPSLPQPNSTQSSPQSIALKSLPNVPFLGKIVFPPEHKPRGTLHMNISYDPELGGWIRKGLPGPYPFGFQLAEGEVKPDGTFSLSIPDLVNDPTLSSFESEVRDPMRIMLWSSQSEALQGGGFQQKRLDCYEMTSKPEAQKWRVPGLANIAENYSNYKLYARPILNCERQ